MTAYWRTKKDRKELKFCLCMREITGLKIIANFAVLLSLSSLIIINFCQWLIFSYEDFWSWFYIILPLIRIIGGIRSSQWILDNTDKNNKGLLLRACLLDMISMIIGMIMSIFYPNQNGKKDSIVIAFILNLASFVIFAYFTNFIR